MDVEGGDEYDFVEFDPEQYTSKTELQEVREELAALRKQHGELSQNFSSHYVAQSNGLNFV